VSPANHLSNPDGSTVAIRPEERPWFAVARDPHLSLERLNLGDPILRQQAQIGAV
jgi:hypothetical protein